MTIDEIQQTFFGKVIGSKFIQHSVYETVAKFPDDLAFQITSSCWFMGSFDDAYAYTFTGNDLKDQHLIFLSDDLFHQSTQQIQFTIAHEIGHVILGHKNSIQYKQTKEEIKRQEKEADAFAHQNGFFA